MCPPRPRCCEHSSCNERRQARPQEPGQGLCAEERTQTDADHGQKRKHSCGRARAGQSRRKCGARVRIIGARVDQALDHGRHRCTCTCIDPPTGGERRALLSQRLRNLGSPLGRTRSPWPDHPLGLRCTQRAIRGKTGAQFGNEGTQHVEFIVRCSFSPIVPPRSEGADTRSTGRWWCKCG